MAFVTNGRDKKNATKTHDLTLMCRLRIRKRVSLAWWKRITRLTRMLAHPPFIHHKGSQMNQIVEIGKSFLAKGDRLFITM